MMGGTYLVQCVATKHRGRMVARDLYCSPWFVKARTWLEAEGAAWLILSAKHGVVRPDEEIDSYDVTLNQMSTNGRREWSEHACNQLRKRFKAGDEVIVLAGQRYREGIEVALREWGCVVSVPMRGLRIGQQLKWLNARRSS